MLIISFCEQSPALNCGIKFDVFPSIKDCSVHPLLKMQFKACAETAIHTGSTRKLHTVRSEP